MLKAIQFPACIANLNPSLTDVNRNALPHSSPAKRTTQPEEKIDEERTGNTLERSERRRGRLKMETKAFMKTPSFENVCFSGERGRRRRLL